MTAAERAPAARPAEPARTARPRPARAAGEPPLLALQRAAGNAAVSARVQRDGPQLDYGRRPPESGATAAGWNPTSRDGRYVDPEQPAGILPFTGTGWSGPTIASRMSQLDLSVRASDAFSCVETSVLMELVQRGPAAVRASLAGYLERYQQQLTGGELPRRLRTRLAQSASFLQDAMARLDARTMTYQDLAQLRSHMYLVHGTPALRNTSFGEEDLLIAEEHYTERPVADQSLARDDVATIARGLLPGEFLSCGIDAQGDRTGGANHNVHIARVPSGALVFYDPWPRAGSQLIFLSPDLHEIDSYFQVRVRGQARNATFIVRARFTPPVGEQP